MYAKKAYGYVLPAIEHCYSFRLGKAIRTGWVRWVHRQMGKTHCEVCFVLDGCFFVRGKTPPCPHHPYCHCTLEAVNDETVFSSAEASSDYSKFDPYLFDPEKFYKRGKDEAFESWGYSISDSPWLQREFEKQALEKYLTDEYTLGKLDKYGQRVSIRVTLPRKRGIGTVSFLTGWMVEPDGKLRLTTPYGGKSDERDGLCRSSGGKERIHRRWRS